jgi:hypothetical protein
MASFNLRELREPETQRKVGAADNPDAPGHLDDSLPWSRVEDAERPPRQVASVLLERDSELAGELPGAIARVFEGPDENTTRRPFRLGDNVQAVVHAVNQVDIGVSGGTEDHARARSYAAERVSGFIAFRKIGLHLDDPGTAAAELEDLPKKVPGDLDGGPGIERTRQDFSGHEKVRYGG